MSWLVPPASAVATLDAIGNVDATGLAQYDLLYYDGSNWADTAGLFGWDGEKILVRDGTAGHQWYIWPVDDGTSNWNNYLVIQGSGWGSTGGEWGTMVGPYLGIRGDSAWGDTYVSSSSPAEGDTSIMSIEMYTYDGESVTAEIGFYGDSTFQTGNNHAQGDMTFYLRRTSASQKWIFPVWLDAGNDCTWIQGHRFRVGYGDVTADNAGYSARPTDYCDMWHDDTDFNFNFVNTTQVDFTGVTASTGYTFNQGAEFAGNVTLDDTIPTLIFQVSNTTRGSISCLDNGMYIDVSENTGDKLEILDGLTTMLKVDATDGLSIYGGGQESDYASLAHDGTDFNFTFTNTTEVTFDTGVNAPSKSRDVTASTNTATDDYGRIVRFTSGSAQTFTLDSDPPEDAWILFDNASGNSWTIATSPTTNLIWAKDATTGNRTLADDGMAVAVHRGSGVWVINGSDLLT